MMFLGLGAEIFDIFRGIGMWIINILYSWIASLHNLFMFLAKVQLFTGKNAALVTDIYERIQVILAVVMVFYVTLEFVKYIVNPDTFSDKEKGGGGLVKRILLVILLMAFTPRIFTMAYDLQERIISSEVIPKVLIGSNYTPDDYNNKGGAFARNLLQIFYEPYTYVDGKVEKKPDCSGALGIGSKECTCDGNLSPEEAVELNLSQLAKNGTMTEPGFCIGERTGKDIIFSDGTVKKNPNLIDVDWFLAIGLGLFVLWVLFNYCMEAGRVIIQFAFLQIIAPVPILSYIAPGKDGMFNKWVKQCVTTYLDLFIRLFIMYLVMMISQILLAFMGNENVELFTGFAGLSEGTRNWIIIFLLIGLLMFAMRAPKMVKELLPGGSNAASGDFGIGGKSAKERFKPVSRGVGAALGLGKGAASVASRSGKALANGVRGLGEAIKRKKQGEGFTRQAVNAYRDRRDRRKMAKDAKDEAAKKKREAEQQELEAYRAKNSDVGRLFDKKNELDKLNQENNRLKELSAKTNRTAAEETEFNKLRSNGVNRINAINAISNDIFKLESKIGTQKSMTDGERALYDLYNASKDYDAVRQKLSSMDRNSADYSKVEAELTKMADALSAAHNKYNNKQVGSLIDSRERLKDISGKINGISDDIRSDYANLTDLTKQYDSMADKNTEAAKQLNNRINKANEYGKLCKEEVECRNNIDKIQKDIAEINSPGFGSAMLENKVSEAKKSREAAVELYAQKKDEFTKAPKSVHGAVASGAVNVVSNAIGVVADTVTGVVNGVKNDDITKVYGNYRKDMDVWVAKREAKEEYVANFGEQSIGQKVTNYVQQKYNKFAKAHALPTTLYALNTEITERENESKDVKSASTAAQNVVSELSTTNKDAQDFIDKQKASQKVFGKSVEIMGERVAIDDISISEFKNRFLDDTAVMKSSVSRREQELANLKSQLYSVSKEERATLENQINNLESEINNDINKISQRERAVPDLLKKLGKIVQRMVFDGEMGVHTGVTDASIISGPDKMRKAFELLQRDAETMKMLSKNMDAVYYNMLLNLNVHTADFDTFDKLKDALEMAGVSLQTYEKDLADQISARKVAKERIELKEKLANAGSSNGGKK